MAVTLSSQEVAALTGKTERTVRRWAESGKIPAERVLNKFNSPEYLFSLDDLEPHLQRKYFDGLKLTHSPEVAQAMTKEAKPLDSYTAEEREEIAFWLRLVKDWQGYRNKPGANKTEVDERFIHLCRLEYPERAISVDTLYHRWNAVRDTDIQRAARFFYVVKISFGCDTRTYATSSKQVDNAVEYLVKVRERLRGVNIENKDFADLIKVYDRPTALFYLDPPYVDTEKYYEGPFCAQDHHRLREVLSHVKGRFILSYNDHSLVRELYADCRIEEITRVSTLSGSGNNQTPYAELIIRNF